MNIIIHPGKLNGLIDAIPSKSYAHRFLICAALADKPSTLRIAASSQDIDATVACLRGLGALVDIQDDIYTITPIDRDNLINCPSIDCGESGSTLRFIMPIASALGGAKIKMHGRLPDRPMTDLIECIERCGASVNKDNDVYHVSCGLSNNHFSICGNVSSQYITGLLLTLPLIGGGKIDITTALESESYIDITIDVMKCFGVNVEKDNNLYIVPNAGFRATTSTIPGDWSNAAFWITNDIAVGNLDINSAQGDKAILNVLENGGCKISIDSSIKVDGLFTHDNIIDVHDIPDSVPALCIFAAKSKYKTTFVNASRLRAKESDRIATCINMLASLGVDSEETQDGFTVFGNGGFTGGEVDCAGDHRIAMAASCAASMCQGNIKLIGAQCVQKSYPNYWEDFKSLGGNIDVEYDR